MDDNIINSYKKNTSGSEKLFNKSQKLLPGGVGGSSPSYEPYPIFIDRADGSKIWDVDGNEYIDFNLCWGVLLVGHSHPKIIEGLNDQLKKGTIYGLPHRESVELAEAIAERFPVDKVRFTNSGSESTLYAIRLARNFTGKDKIIKIEGSYHGVADPLHISKKPPKNKAGPVKRPTSIPYGKGITQGTIEDTLNAPFNDIETMSDILEENLGEVAAIIVEPIMMNSGVVPPSDGYLKQLRKLADEHNVLLIFDEVKTGVKVAMGGAAEYYNVKPDLITLAKAIGGGLPLGACAGRSEIIDKIGEEGLFGTYSSNPLSVRAGKITLTDILTKSAYKRLEGFGNYLMSGYKDIIDDFDLSAVVQGVNAVAGILFCENKVENYRDWTYVDVSKMDEYLIRMVDKGVIPMSHGADEEWLISVQHDKEDLDTHLEAFKSVAPRLK